MGFGSYDESEQDNQTLDAGDFEDEDSVNTDTGHEGSVEYEFGASNEELLDRLQDIKRE